MNLETELNINHMVTKLTGLKVAPLNKSMDELDNIVEKWAYFFKHAEETNEDELAQIIGSDFVIKRAYDELNRFSWTEIELNTYEQELDFGQVRSGVTCPRP